MNSSERMEIVLWRELMVDDEDRISGIGLENPIGISAGIAAIHWSKNDLPDSLTLRLGIG
jgi:hypothetical protein